jgi:hypothetical protein
LPVADPDHAPTADATRQVRAEALSPNGLALLP